MELLILILILLLATAAGAVVWWLRDRLDRLDEGMRAYSDLTLVPDRLQALARVLEGLDPPRLREELDAIHVALDRVEALLASPPASPESEGDSLQREQPPRSVQVRAVIVRGLRERGCESVYLREEDQVLDEDPAMVRVECRRKGLRLTGTVTVEGDQLTQVELEPSYPMFP